MDEAKKYIQVELDNIEAKIAETLAMIPELGEEAEKELIQLNEQKASLERAIAGEDSFKVTSLLESVQSNTFKSIIMEVRPGVGGDEAKIWAEDLIRMYSRYATTQNWKVEILDEGVIKIKGSGAFDLLKYETGVHRVQRVPETEAQGRIHTSTASVVVLPEVPESAVDIREDDLEWAFVRGGGHGGQNVNKVATSVRLTHKPSGIVVKASQERFQEQNRKIALSLLRSQLWEIEEEKRLAVLAGQRMAIGLSMRSEKIRTFNYPQNRVTDHRIGKSWHQLARIIEGGLDDVLQAVAVPELPQQE